MSGGEGKPELNLLGLRYLAGGPEGSSQKATCSRDLILEVGGWEGAELLAVSKPGSASVGKEWGCSRRITAPRQGWCWGGALRPPTQMSSPLPSSSSLLTPQLGLPHEI